MSALPIAVDLPPNLNRPDGNVTWFLSVPTAPDNNSQIRPIKRGIVTFVA